MYLSRGNVLQNTCFICDASAIRSSGIKALHSIGHFVTEPRRKFTDIHDNLIFIIIALPINPWFKCRAFYPPETYSHIIKDVVDYVVGGYARRAREENSLG